MLKPEIPYSQQSDKPISKETIPDTGHLRDYNHDILPIGKCPWCGSDIRFKSTFEGLMQRCFNPECRWIEEA